MWTESKGYRWGNLQTIQTSTRFLKTTGLLALPPPAARPTQHYRLENVWLVGLGHSKPPQTHLAVKQSRVFWDCHQTTVCLNLCGLLRPGFLFWPVLGRFLDKVGPGTATHGSGLKHATHIDEDQPRRPNLMSFRYRFLVGPNN